VSGGRGARQAILRGETLYLRALDAEDAATASAWRDTPWPVPAKQTEAWLEKEIPENDAQRQWRLIACRLDGDAPVGSAWIDDLDDWPTTWVRLHAAPLLSGDERQAVLAEMLGALVPWLGGERGAMSIELDADSRDAGLLAAAESLGMRVAYRLREGFWRDGERGDWVTMQWLNPAWLARLDDPGPGIALEGEPVEAPRAPAPLRWPESADPLPANTVIASERLALRPFEPDDSRPIARSFVEEPVAISGHSRLPISPIALTAYHAEIAGKEPPEDVEFAIVLRETGEVIGENGLYYIDWLSRTAETGTWIYRPEHRGGGIGTEAKHLLLEWAFQRAGLHMVWSWVYQGNDRSAAALRKQGYRDAGRIDWVGMAGNGPLSARVFDLLASEWRAARR
jgi:RimJ/RimL family protein N-acetyltransferase